MNTDQLVAQIMVVRAGQIRRRTGETGDFIAVQGSRQHEGLGHHAGMHDLAGFMGFDPGKKASCGQNKGDDGNDEQPV